MGQNGRARMKLVAAASILMLTACDGVDVERQSMPGADAGRGRETIVLVGCGVCHTIPGVSWPKGRVGPALAGFGSRALIAGRISNEPATLPGFIRNAPAFAPGVGMPPMPLTDQEARDVAAYLYSL